MSLIICPECNKGFSDKAVACPNCGCPTEEALSIIKEQEEEKRKEESICPFCGSESIDSDGYCNECGKKISVLRQYIEKQNVQVGNLDSDATIGFTGNPYVRCPSCGRHNPISTFTCQYCGRKISIKEYHVVDDNQEINDGIKPENTNTVKVEVQDKKGGIFTKIKCPRCYSLNFSPVDTKKKFSIGKSLVGNTVGKEKMPLV